jgi:hypothetical protein
MTDNVQSAMLEILKRIQADVSGLKTDVSGLKTDASGLKSDMTDLKGRMEKLEALVRKQGRDSAAMLVMMRGTPTRTAMAASTTNA